MDIAGDRPTTEQQFARIAHRLVVLRRRALLLELAAGLAGALLVGLWALLVWTTLEALLFMAPQGRTALGLIAALGGVATLLFYLRRRLPDLLSQRRFALRVERRCPALGQRLISALELWHSPRAGRLYSPDLLAATVAAADAALQTVDRRAILDTRPLRRHARYLGATVLLGGLALLTSDSMSDALYRCAHPLTPFARRAQTAIALYPGDLEVVKGEDAAIAIRFSGHRPRTARILRREADTAPWVEEEIVVEETDSLTYLFPSVQRPFSYRVLAGDGESATHAVAVIDPPAVRRLRLTYRYPAYSGLPVRVEEESGDIHSLAGTRVDFEIIASKPLATAALVLDDSLRRPARVEGNRAFADLEVVRSGHYQVELVDAKGIRNRDPIRYTVEPIADEPPTVTISDPGRDTDLPENMQVMLAVEATDDFGIGGLWLISRVNEEAEQSRPLRFTPGPEVNLIHLWDLSAADLLPEDRIYYRVEAADEDQVSGPKRSASREYVLRFPSLYELYEEATQEQEEELDQLDKLAEEGREVGEYLEQTRRELLKNEELTWEKKKELEATIGREAERAKAVEELSQELQETLEQLEENGLNSDEILEKIAEIRELMDEVITPEMREALQAVQQALEAEDPTQLAEALKQFNEDQRAFQERLERTIALLEQVRAEQQLEAAVQQATDLERRQGKINEELSQETAGERLQMQETSLQRDTERLQQELQELSRTLEPFSQQAAQQMAAQAQAMEQNELSGRMQQMTRQMKAGAIPQARRLGQGLEQELGELAASMQQMQGEFIAEQKQRLAADIQRAMRELLYLSHRQESLAEETGRLRQAPPAELAEEQFALMQGVAQVTERIGAVSNKTMALENPLVATLGYTLRSMQESAAALGQQNGGGSQQPQSEAVRHLNEAVLLLRESLENLAQSRMPSSFAEAMQKMMGLSEQQAQLNQATQQSFAQGQQAGRQGRDMRAEVGRLSAQQRRIYEALEQLRRETRGHRGTQQRIGAIEQEMEQVLSSMQRRQLDPNTLNRQQRILQRMLDASRSIHTRGYDEDKRRSESGRDLPYAGPSWLPDDLGQSYSQLRQAMKQALEGPYPDEYRSLIRRYYEQLYEDARLARTPGDGAVGE